jgi:hypothetical protein
VSGGLVVSEEDGVSETLLREAEAFEASLSD